MAEEVRTLGAAALKEYFAEDPLGHCKLHDGIREARTGITRETREESELAAAACAWT